MIDKYYKLKLCNFYEKYKKCDKGDECNYAHGKEELRFFKKDDCYNGLKCFKKDCDFSHPENWNPENNKRICEFYANGYCNKEENCKFKHCNINVEKDIGEKKENSNKKNNCYKEDIKINEEYKKIDINNNDDFPVLKENVIFNTTISNNYNENEVVQNQFNNQYSEINNREDIINKKDNIIKINKDKENNSSPNIEIFMNGFKYNDKNNILNINYENIINNTEKLINILYNNSLNLVKEIKENIDKEFTGDNEKYGINMKLKLNEIISEINLFKNNYKDVINLIQM